MKPGFVLVALVCLSATAAAEPPLSRAAKLLKERLDPEVFANFSDEIADSYPDHVKAYAIVRAQILGKRERTYCPLKTAQCGEDPTCGHPKSTRIVYDIDILETLYSSAPAKAVPKSLPAYTIFQPIELKVNDEVWLSLYVYTRDVSANGNTNISRIKKIEKPKAADPEKPTKKPTFTPRPR